MTVDLLGLYDSRVKEELEFRGLVVLGRNSATDDVEATVGTRGIRAAAAAAAMTLLQLIITSVLTFGKIDR